MKIEIELGAMSPAVAVSVLKDALTSYADYSGTMMGVSVNETARENWIRRGKCAEGLKSKIKRTEN